MKDEKSEQPLLSAVHSKLPLPEVDELGMDRNPNGEMMFKCAIVGPSEDAKDQPGAVLDAHIDQIFRIDFANWLSIKTSQVCDDLQCARPRCCGDFNREERFSRP